MKILQSTKAKLIIGAIIFTIIFSLGAYARPGIDLTYNLLSGMFSSKQVAYVAPVSEYQQKVDELWHSDKHQQTCKANAAAAVSLELADKYLKETQKQQIMAVYELPQSLVDETNRINKSLK